MKTINEIRNNVTSQLIPLYGQQESSAIAFTLLEYVLNQDKTSLLTNRDQKVESEIVNAVDRGLQRLLKSEPIQYVLGESIFLGRKFYLNSSTLIPRPETEEVVLRVIGESCGGERILDIGSGSGAISISLSLEIPQSKITGLEISDEAITISKRNAALYSCEVKFINLDFLKDYPRQEKFDIIVSNPPYIMNSEKSLMADNVLNYEPELALFVEDSNPLIFYERIASLKNELLSADGKIIVEINERFGKEVRQLFFDAGAGRVEIAKDINNKDRIAIAYFGNS